MALAEHPSAFSGLYLPYFPFHRNSPPSATTIHGVLSWVVASWREQPWEALGLMGESSILQVIAYHLLSAVGKVEEGLWGWEEGITKMVVGELPRIFQKR